MLFLSIAMACPPSTGPHLELEGSGGCLQIDTPEDMARSDDPEVPGVEVWLPLGDADAYRLTLTNVCAGGIRLRHVEEAGPFDLDLGPGDEAEVGLPGVPDREEQGFLVEVEEAGGAWVLLVKNVGGVWRACVETDTKGCQHVVGTGAVVPWLARRR